MKSLIIPEQQDLDIGYYGPACEGFVDAFKALFGQKKKGPFDENLAAVKGTRGASVLIHKLENDLRLTYDNPEWVKNTLGDGHGLIQVKALAGANVDGKAITAPGDLLKVAKSMFVVVEDTYRRELPFVQKRKKLVEDIAQKKDPAYADQVWLDNKDWLMQSASDRFQQKYKGHLPALSNSPKEDGEWPISDKQKWNHIFSNAYPDHKTDGMFEAPSAKNAKEFASTIRGLVKMLVDLNKMADESRLPHWEFLEVEWDDLKHGPEIFDRIASADGWYEVSDLINGLADTCYTLSLGLYIAMFDKHMVAKPASEGWVDRIKNTFFGRKQETTHDKFDSSRAIQKVASFVENPNEFTVTGKSFDTGAKLYLSLNGRSPSPDQLGHAFDKTIREAAVLSKKLWKDAIIQARYCKPLIEHFEKTMIDNMDREGNVDQEILDAAMVPLIAAMPKIVKGYFNNFIDDQKQCDSWLGGQPFHVKQTGVVIDGVTTCVEDYKDIQPVAVPKADIHALKKLAEVVLKYSDSKLGLGYLDEDIFGDHEDDYYAGYEFDRPVRHLWEMMNEQQCQAIDIIYSYDSNTQSLAGTLEYCMDRVYASLLKYLDWSLVRNQA